MKQGKLNRTLIEKNESALPQGILMACWAKDQRKSKRSAVMVEISIEHPIAISSIVAERWPTSDGVSNYNRRGKPPNLGTQMMVYSKTGAPKDKQSLVDKHEANVKRLQQRIVKAAVKHRKRNQNSSNSVHWESKGISSQKNANPFDSAWEEYFSKRQQGHIFRKKNTMRPNRYSRILTAGLRRHSKAFSRLEPYAGKLARTVLRGNGTSNGPRLPDPVNICLIRGLKINSIFPGFSF